MRLIWSVQCHVARSTNVAVFLSVSMFWSPTWAKVPTGFRAEFIRMIAWKYSDVLESNVVPIQESFQNAEDRFLSLETEDITTVNSGTTIQLSVVLE